MNIISEAQDRTQLGSVGDTHRYSGTYEASRCQWDEDQRPVNVVRPVLQYLPGSKQPSGACFLQAHVCMSMAHCRAGTKVGLKQKIAGRNTILYSDVQTVPRTVMYCTLYPTHKQRQRVCRNSE